MGISLLVFNCLVGCGILNLDRGINEFVALPATQSKGAAPIQSHKPFVGVAISGGGSRSASFGAAVMQELERYGFLEHVTAISGVSGGTLPSAYYVLNRNSSDWSWETLRTLVVTNFYRKFLWQHFNPWGFLNYLGTEYNRSDMMAEIFDDVLFRDATFGELDSKLPTLLINAAILHTGSRGQWSFTEQNFRSLNSNLRTFPISRAVAASTAVPGIFNGIALRHYNADGSYRYFHLVDGGISENLGVEALVQFYIKSRTHDFTNQKSMIDEGAAPAGCFIFAIDSYPDKVKVAFSSNRRDLRSGTDFIIDRNLLTTLDIMANHARDRFFASIKGNADPEGPFYQLTYRYFGSGYRCAIWHIYSGHLLDSTHFYTLQEERNAELNDKYRRWRQTLANSLPEIETHWKLVAPGTCGPKALQEALYTAAKMLVTEDRLSQNWARGWFSDRGLKLRGELPKDFDESEYELFESIQMEYRELADGNSELRCKASS